MGGAFTLTFLLLFTGSVGDSSLCCGDECLRKSRLERDLCDRFEDGAMEYDHGIRIYEKSKAGSLDEVTDGLGLAGWSRKIKENTAIQVGGRREEEKHDLCSRLT